MRLFAIGSTLLLATAALLALAPAGAADSPCADALDGVTGDDCQHAFCVGRSTATYYDHAWESCKLSEEDLPNPCGPTAYCEPGDLPPA